MKDTLLLPGDCLQLLDLIPNDSVDMVLTDPPYGMAYQSGYKTTAHKPILQDVDRMDWLRPLAAGMHRCLAPNSAAYVFCSFHKIDLFKQTFEQFFKVKNLLVWEKNNTSMGDLKADFAPKAEFILLLHKGRPFIRGRRDPNIFKFKRTLNKRHPTEKPEDLCAYLISKFSDKGATILDPFMGSGTTGVACKNTGRDFIGMELDPDYFKIAKNRINNL